MKFLVALCVFVALTVAARPKWRDLTDKYSFEQYKEDFGKYYEGEEDNMRRGLFVESLTIVLAHNKLESSYKMGINHMSDWTEEEFKATLGYHKGLGHLQVTERMKKYSAGELAEMKFGDRELPQSVDWRTKNVLTSVKDQGLVIVCVCVFVCLCVFFVFFFFFFLSFFFFFFFFFFFLQVTVDLAGLSPLLRPLRLTGPSRPELLRFLSFSFRSSRF